MALYKWGTLLAGSGVWFWPESEWETGQVLKKTSTGYSWEDLAEWWEEGQVLMRTEDWYAWCDWTLWPKYWYIDLLVVWWWWAWGYISCWFSNYPNSSWWGGGWVIQCLCYPITSNSDYITVCVWKWWFAWTCSGTWCCWTTQSWSNSSFWQFIAYWWWKWGAVNTSAENWWSWWWGWPNSIQPWKWTCWQWHDWANAWASSWWWWAWAAGSNACWWIWVQSDLTGTMLYYWWWWSHRPEEQPEWSAACWCYWWGWAWQCNHTWTRNISWCQWIVVVRYKTDWSCWIKNTSSWWCKYTCWDYTIHCFTEDAVFIPTFK